MLTLHTLPRNIKQFIKLSSQQLHTSLKLLTAKDTSSSSSDSSDSDSDKEDKGNVKKAENGQSGVDIPDTLARLDALLSRMTIKENKSANLVKSFHVAIKPKTGRIKELPIKVKAPKDAFENLVKSAAKDVAITIKGDAKKNELELLSRVLNTSRPASGKEELSGEEATSSKPTDLSYLVTGMKIDQTVDTKRLQLGRERAVKKIQERFKEPSISQSLLYAKSVHKLKDTKDTPELNAVVKPLGIFKNDSETSDAPRLTTWELMEEREMKLSILNSPENVFEELILWTDQGKLWHFPIDNEQGMEEEETIHFSEHVFMERHLKGWCPKRGPIRHFMELVCTGLSKNPYMTVEEKVGHITWYKNYFEDKKALLHELGVLDATPSLELKKEIKV